MNRFTKKIFLRIKRCIKRTSKAIFKKFYQGMKFLGISAKGLAGKIIYRAIDLSLSRAMRRLKVKNKVWLSAFTAFLIIIFIFSQIFAANRTKILAADQSYHTIYRYVNGTCEEYQDVDINISHPGWIDGSCPAPTPIVPTPTPTLTPIPGSPLVIHSHTGGTCHEGSTTSTTFSDPDWEYGSCHSEIIAPTPTPDISPEPSPEPSVDPAPDAVPSPTPSIEPAPTAATESTPTPAPEILSTPNPSVESTPAPTLPSTPAPIANRGGGNSIMFQQLTITREPIAAINNNSVTISWLTSQFSTSRVIYDTVSGRFDINGAPPSYGFAYYKEGDDSGLEKVTFHSVTLTDIIPGATYYYRTVSTGSLIISQEYSFIGEGSIPVLSPVSAPVLSPQPLPEPSPAFAPKIIAKETIPDKNKNRLIKNIANVDVSIVDYLNSAGQPSSFDYRSGLAEQNSIKNYTGTADQNTYLLGLIKNFSYENKLAVEPDNIKIEQAGLNETGAASEEIKNEGTEYVSGNKKEFQSGLASAAKENSIFGGIINQRFFAGILIMIFFLAIVALTGKEFWLKVSRSEKN